MNSTTDRLQNERDFHDRQAAARRRDLSDQDLIFTDDTYLDHEPWIRPAFDWLEPLAAESVLDLGCGHGMASVVLARRGAEVTALDLSPGYLDETRRRAEMNDVRVRCVEANGEQLPFADASYSRIFGNAILHHLNIEQVAREIHRVLKPGGRAAFAEPWAGNPLLGFFRKHVSYPGKCRTADETPLTSRDVRVLKTIFPGLRMQGFQLLSMAGRFVGRRVRTLEVWDRILLRRFPDLDAFVRYVLIFIQKEKTAGISG